MRGEVGADPAGADDVPSTVAPLVALAADPKPHLMRARCSVGHMLAWSLFELSASR